MKVQIMMSVSGMMPIEVPDEKRADLEALLEHAGNGPIDVDEFEQVTGIPWDWDAVLNNLDFEISDVDVPAPKKG